MTRDRSVWRLVHALDENRRSSSMPAPDSAPGASLDDHGLL